MPPLDLSRLHRFLLAHEADANTTSIGYPTCGACGSIITEEGSRDHFPTCEWLALVAMTKGE